MRHRVARLLLAAGGALAAVVVSAASATLAAPAASGNLFASVDMNGTLVAGQGVTGVTHINTGHLE